MSSSSSSSRAVGTLWAVVLACGAPAAAGAYSISNELAQGCHEGITTLALRTVRAELPTAAPLPVTPDEEALVDDLQFLPDADMRDLGGATLLIAVRDNDLKGRGSDDLSALAEVHGDPKNQFEHCLRGPDDVEPSGSSTAFAACRAYVRERARAAIAALDASGRPDPSNRTPMTVHLSMRGTVTAPLPTFYVAAGQAMHAIEDAFAHSYRSADQRRPTVALTWLRQVDRTWLESRDGPRHAKALDRCDDADEFRKTRRLLAVDAATAFLRATLDPTKSADQKLAAVDAVTDTALGVVAGCTFDNGWCNAVEAQYADRAAGGCSAASTSVGGWLSGLALVLAVAAATRRRSWVRPSSGGLALALALAVALTPALVKAQSGAGTTTTTQTVRPATPGAPATSVTTQTPAPDATGPAHEAPPPTIVPVPQPGPADPSQTAPGAALRVSGAVDKPSLAGAVGVRLRVSRHWALGLDGEWNPWLAYTGTLVRAGVLNVYGTAMLRLPLAYERFNLRVSLSAGASYLLTDLYGAPSGSLGVYLGASPLSVEWKLSRFFYLVIDLINVAVPIPQLSGVPLVFPQYRGTLGLEIYSG